MPPISSKKVEKSIRTCAACGGSGKNTRGTRCIPCNGEGNLLLGRTMFKPQVKGLEEWACPTCGKKHLGFKHHQCRNKNCRAYSLD